MRRLWALSPAVLVVAAGCEQDITEVDRLTPGAVQLTIVSGSDQQGDPGAMLSQPLVVKVTSAAGTPVAGQIVNFQVVSGGGKVFAGSNITNSLGIAQERWTLGTDTTQAQRVEVRAVGNETGEPIVYAAFKATHRKPAPTVSVDLQLVRMTAGTGEVLVSSGVPLPAGLLKADALRTVRLLIGGQEQPIYVEALSGRHKDGTVRSVLVQLRRDLGGTPVPAQLVIGASRTTTDLSKSSTAYAYLRPLPEAVAVPSSVAYLISTDLVGPTVAAPGFNSAYESNFVSQSDSRWTLMQSEYGTTLAVDPAIGRNYYDRALAHWAYWVRTGNVEYFRRAAHYLMAYREMYMRPNNCAVQPHHAQIEGLELHYLLSGDPASLQCVGQIADVYAGGWATDIGKTTHDYMESRIQARVLLAHLTAWKLSAPSASGHDWAALARQDLTRILGTQGADGAYRFSAYCSGQLNYMAGLLNDSYIKYHSQFEADSRILPAVKRSVDFLWTQWNASAGGFQYMDVNCPGYGDTSASADLNLLMVNGYGWVYQQTGDATYRTRGDTAFDEGVAKAWIGTSAGQADKQYNEQYNGSFRYLRYRQ